MKLPVTALTLSLLAAVPAFAAGSAADHVSATDPYVRLAPPGQNVTGAFVTFKNADGVDHKVVKAESPASKVAELHTHVNEGGVMKMRPVKEIDIKAGGNTELKPGGLHIMLIGLKAPLKESEVVPITVTFEDGSSKKLDAPVRKPQAQMAPAMNHDEHMMHH